MDKKNGVFIALWCKEAVFHNKSNKTDKEEKFPLVLLINRWDNTIGFVGGIVDKNESEEEAIVRITKEEINFDIKNEFKKLKLINEKTNKYLNSKFYSLEVSEEIVKEILKGSVDAKNYYTKVRSVFPVTINKKCFENISKSIFSFGAYEDFEDMLSKNKIMDPYNIFINKITKPYGIKDLHKVKV